MNEDEVKFPRWFTTLKEVAFQLAISAGIALGALRIFKDSLSAMFYENAFLVVITIFIISILLSFGKAPEVIKNIRNGNK